MGEMGESEAVLEDEPQQPEQKEVMLTGDWQPQPPQPKGNNT